MEVEVKINNNSALVKISGRLDTVSALDFENKIKVLFDLEDPDITLDCSDLNYISSSGLRHFLSIYKNVASKNGKLVLKNVSAEIKEVLDMTGFTAFLNII